jgi:lipoprotein-releasing system ATP-binding protein
MTIIEAIDIQKIYEGNSNPKPVHVLQGVDLSIEEGSVNAIIGSSGSGKSTLLHLLGGLDKPSSGRILFRGEDIAKYDDNSLAKFRSSKIGFVFQFHHLLPEFTALENVLMPALAAGQFSSETKNRAVNLLDEFGLSDRLDHRPSMLSGGEQQRVAMARALMNKPEVLLADEPTGNLDEANTTVLMEQILNLNETHRLTLIIVTHDTALAAKCENVYTIKHGVIQHPIV